MQINILNEKLSSFVYTKETLRVLLLMLRTNKLILEPYHKDKKQYYVLKTKTSRKELIDDGENFISIIQLNGDKLNAEIKSKNTSFYLNDKNSGTGDNLYLDEPVIKDAYKFIEQISIFIEGEKIIAVPALKEIEKICAENNIPLYFFNKRENFANNSRNKKYQLDNPDYNYRRKNFAAIPNSLKLFFFLWENDDLSKVPDRYGNYIHNLMVDQKKNNFIQRVKSDYKEVADNPVVKEKMDKIFKNSDTKNFEMVIDELAAKWKAIINSFNKKQPK